MAGNQRTRIANEIIKASGLQEDAKITSVIRQRLLMNTKDYLTKCYISMREGKETPSEIIERATKLCV